MSRKSLRGQFLSAVEYTAIPPYSATAHETFNFRVTKKFLQTIGFSKFGAERAAEQATGKTARQRCENVCQQKLG